MDNELERTWKGFAVAYFNMLSFHSSGKTKENHEQRQSEKSSSGWDLNQASLDYNSGVLTPEPFAQFILYKFNYMV
jgi:hypothetical protein